MAQSPPKAASSAVGGPPLDEPGLRISAFDAVSDTLAGSVRSNELMPYRIQYGCRPGSACGSCR